jgi:rare lipoprotein A
MRSTVTALISLVCALIVSSLPASAAARWSCEGPDFVCERNAPITATGDRAERRALRSAKNTRRETARLYRSQRAGSRVRSAAKRLRAPRAVAARTPRTVTEGASYSGKASYYWQPQRVASGGWFNPNAMTAAHKTLPFGTRVRVTNVHNGRSVVVTINDRGPYIAGRIIDLSSAAAGVIGMKSSGVVPVRVAVLGRG